MKNNKMSDSNIHPTFKALLEPFFPSNKPEERHREFKKDLTIDLFDVFKNEDRSQWEFTPKEEGYTSYTVHFSECDNIEDAWIAVYLSLRVLEERSKKNKKILTIEDIPEFKKSIDGMTEEAKLRVDNRLLRIEIGRLREALDRIASPIKWMQTDLKEGEQLDGRCAIDLANNASWLSSIAQQALKD